MDTKALRQLVDDDSECSVLRSHSGQSRLTVVTSVSNIHYLRELSRAQMKLRMTEENDCRRNGVGCYGGHIARLEKSPGPHNGHNSISPSERFRDAFEVTKSSHKYLKHIENPTWDGRFIHERVLDKLTQRRKDKAITESVEHDRKEKIRSIYLRHLNKAEKEAYFAVTVDEEKGKPKKAESGDKSTSRAKCLEIVTNDEVPTVDKVEAGPISPCRRMTIMRLSSKLVLTDEQLRASLMGSSPKLATTPSDQRNPSPLTISEADELTKTDELLALNIQPSVVEENKCSSPSRERQSDIMARMSSPLARSHAVISQKQAAFFPESQSSADDTDYSSVSSAANLANPSSSCRSRLLLPVLSSRSLLATLDDVTLPGPAFDTPAITPLPFQDDNIKRDADVTKIASPRQPVDEADNKGDFHITVPRTSTRKRQSEIMHLMANPLARSHAVIVQKQQLVTGMKKL